MQGDRYRDLAEQSGVVKSLLPTYLRYNPGNSWIYRQGYYDDPEGVNLFGKLVALNKYALMAGSFMAWGDICLVSKVTDYQRVIGKFCFWTYPFVTSATCFTVATYAATRIRRTDDT